LLLLLLLLVLLTSKSDAGDQTEPVQNRLCQHQPQRYVFLPPHLLL